MLVCFRYMPSNRDRVLRAISWLDENTAITRIGRPKTAVGPSRGGQATRIHAVTDLLGRPAILRLTAGNVADVSMAKRPTQSSPDTRTERCRSATTRPATRGDGASRLPSAGSRNSAASQPATTSGQAASLSAVALATLATFWV